MRRSAVTLGMACILGLLPNGATAAQDAIPVTVSDELRQDLVGIAKTMGFSVSEAYRRHELREKADAAIAAATADKSNFAGAFQDDVDGTWRLRILYVGDATSARAEIASLIPDSFPVSWEQVRYSAADLEGIHDAVVDLWFELGIQRINYVAIDVAHNQVIVATPTEDRDLSHQLASAYGSAVKTIVEVPGRPVACNSTTDLEGGSRFNCTPWRGGIEAQKVDGQHTGMCTLTMWARHQDNSSLKYLITAGHCGNEDSQTFYHNGISIGVSTVNSLNLSSPLSDSRRIPATGNSTQMNRIYETPTTKSYAITSVRSETSQDVNDWVCKVGVGDSTFGRLCGQITATGTFSVAGYPFVFTGRRADFNGTCWFACDGWGLSGGDSGATVVYNQQIHGVATTDNGWYSLANRVQTDLDVFFCLNVTCTLP